MGITNGILVDIGISHSSEWISWPPVLSDHRYDTGGPCRADAMQGGSRQRGPPLGVPHSR